MNTVLDAIPVGLAVINRAYKVEHWNRWLELHSEIESSRILGSNLFKHFPSLNKPSFLRSCKSVFAFGNVAYLSQKLHTYVFPFELPPGQNNEFEFMQQSGTMSPLRDDDGTINRLMITVQDVTDAVTLELHLRKTNLTDGLTSVFNRRFIDRRLPEEFVRHTRYDRKLSLCMIDLDRFKAINDTHGHLCGDRVLVEICRVIREALRGVDVFARYGGEEFIAVFPETSLERAMPAAERIRHAVEQNAFTWKGQDLAVTVSIGVAALAGHESIDQLIADADGALYRAKQAGRNRVEAA